MADVPAFVKIRNNVESPRRGINFVTKKIVKNISDITKGKLDKLSLGNLNAKRDWSHAKDSALAMWKILQADKPDDYVIASGECHSVREFVELAFKYVGIEIAWKGSGIDEVGYDKKTNKILITIDRVLFRPDDVKKVMFGDTSKLKRETGWVSSYKFKDIVKEMIEHELNDL